MGSVVGKITVEIPKYQIIATSPHYEIRKYEPSIVAEVTHDPKDMKGDPDGGFMILANYIGALGNPQNTKPEKNEPESIPMTAPVITKGEKGKKLMTMQFVLPGSRYSKVEYVPKPIDPRVMIKQVEERKYGVVTFSGVANDKLVQEKLGKLKAKLEEDGYKILGEHLLARYNPPWTLPPFRTNEIYVPVD